MLVDSWHAHKRRSFGARALDVRLTAVVVLVLGCAGCGSGESPATGGLHTAAPSDRDHPATYARAGRGQLSAQGRPVAQHPVVSHGSWGVRSSWVAAENAKPGSPSWRITGAPARGDITGFANLSYVAQGQRVVLRVSTTAPSFRVRAYRIGWYGGVGAREVWHSAVVPGRRQPACQVTAGVNMVSCQNWRPSLAITVTAAFVPGDYVLKLVGSGDQQSYVLMTVWDPSSHATYLVKNDVFTLQAWNTYGGFDYYRGQGSCPQNVYPLCSRARVVSFDRPYDHQGAGDFLSLEAPLVWFLERHGLDVTYATDVTVAQHPDILARHRTVLSLGHDECWSLRERRAAVRARRHGTNWAFFGASAMLRHVRPEPSRLGPARRLVDYRDSAADPMNGKGRPRQVTGNTWSDPPSSWPENRFVGEDYNGFLEPGRHAPLTVTDATSAAFTGTGLRNGEHLPGVIASDVDSLEPGLGHPADVQILAHSPLPAAHGQAVAQSGVRFYSDMTYYTDPRSGAGVWDSGTNNWIPALMAGHGETRLAAGAVRRITGNVLRMLGRGPAGRSHHSTPNWRRYYSR
ncbi:MAG: hypothetical protein J2P22_06715 [Nocardioides sp.]|nr:hypothetical protein [Nocardioides sp.]